MAVETHATTVADLKVYKDKNPVKFLHKFGDLDFNNLPPNFENMIPYYKRMVVSERVQREMRGADQNIPAITPFIFEVWKPKAEVKPEPVVEPVVAPVAPVVEPVVEPTAPAEVVAGAGIGTN